MAKRDLVIVDEEDGGLSLSPSTPKKTEDRSNPIDADRGEQDFDDLNSRFSMSSPAPRANGSDRDEAPGDVDITDEEMRELFPDPKKLGKKSRDEDADEEDDEDDEEEDTRQDDPVDSEDDERDEEDESDEPSPRKNKFQKRLEREQRLRREDREEIEDLRAEITGLRAKVEGKETENEFNTKQAELGSKIAAKQAELKAAMEAGETDKVISLTDELDDLKYERRSSREKFDAGQKAREERKTTASAIVARRVNQWKRKHPKYGKDSQLTSVINVIDSQLAAEGFDPETDEYYEELDRRAAKHYPKEFKRAKPEREQRRHPSQHSEREQEGARRAPKKVGNFERGRNGQVKLSKFDVQTMREFSLDPTNPEDVREYVRNNS